MLLFRSLSLVCVLGIGAVGCDEGVFVGGGGTTSSGEAGGGSGGGGASGGATSTSTDTGLFEDPPEGSFPCGDGYCDAATSYCVVNVDGPCCGSSASCVPYPVGCDAEGTKTCACIQVQVCPCGGVPEEQCQTEGVEPQCWQYAPLGDITFECLHP